MKGIYLVIVLAVTVAAAGGVLVGPQTAGYAALMVALPGVYFAGRAKRAAEGRAQLARAERKELETKLNGLETVVVDRMNSLASRLGEGEGSGDLVPGGDYAKLVDELISAAPELRHRLKSSLVGREFVQLQRSSSITPHLQRTSTEAVHLANAFISRGVGVAVETCSVPSNLFVEKGRLLVLYLPSGRSWTLVIDNWDGDPDEVVLRIEEESPKGPGEQDPDSVAPSVVSRAKTGTRSARVTCRFASDGATRCSYLHWPFLGDPTSGIDGDEGEVVRFFQLERLGDVLLGFCAQAIQEEVALLA